MKNVVHGLGMPSRLLAILTILGISCGCDLPQRSEPPAPKVRVDPLAVQQLKAYPEVSTGMFVSLADFETTPARPLGHRQVEHFEIGPPDREGLRKFVVNVTRTGAGAMQVVLAANAELIFRIPHVHDFTDYTLLSMALHSESLRDDLQVTLTSEGASWTSHRRLVQPGWNTVLVDIRRLREVPGFDVTRVRTVRLGFPDAAGAVTFCLDDILLIDNRRRIEPAPAGVTLTKGGLDYTLKSPYFPAPLNLYQGRDGLWRVDKHQPTVQLASPGATPSGLEEQLELMGPRKVGQIELLEVNPLRLRLGNTWYFPTRRGEWVSLAVRKIRWEYTFYADGRWVTHVELNNAGGEEIGSLGIFVDLSVAWARGAVRKKLLVERFMGPVGRWSYLLVPQGPNQNTIYSNYLRPGRIRVDIGGKAPSVGDMDRDGFDESQGCYSLQAHSGNCRFTVIAPPGGLLNPVFRVAGPWGGPVHVNSEGRAIRNITRLSDGSVLFCLAGLLERPTAVEITSEAPSYTSD